jgi:uncharacterized metal-binding protein
MPNARTHDIITVVTAATATPLVLTSALPEIGPITTIVLVGTYLASGLVFSPDLDLHSRPYRRWGLFRFIWIPYQKLVPHRSWLSHSFVLGPLIRVLYFATALTLLYLAVTALINLFTPIDSTGTLLNLSRTLSVWTQSHPILIAYALVGLLLGGASHTLADIIYSWVKRKINRILRP